MSWISKLWESVKRVFHRFVSYFRKKQEVRIIPKTIRLEESLNSFIREINDLLNLKEFYKNDYNNNIEQIQEIDKKISILRQEMFSKSRELKREKAKENLKKLRRNLDGK